MFGITVRKSWLTRSAMVMLACATLVGCNNLKRLSEVGEAPKLSAIDNPTEKRGYVPVSLPMPAPHVAERNPNSLWRPGARAFFKDQRAHEVGDLLTVIITIEDEASLDNTTTTSRSTTEDAGINQLLGFEARATDILPDAVNPANLFNVDSTSSNKGDGSLEREETINLKLAALIVQSLPNGNLVIHGRQEVRVNKEMREVMVSGVIRPEDITSENTIPAEKIAEARIAYGGRGTLTDIQTPRWGTQVMDILLPF